MVIPLATAAAAVASHYSRRHCFFVLCCEFKGQPVAVNSSFCQDSDWLLNAQASWKHFLAEELAGRDFSRNTSRGHGCLIRCLWMDKEGKPDFGPKIACGTLGNNARLAWCNKHCHISWKRQQNQDQDSVPLRSVFLHCWSLWTCTDFLVFKSQLKCIPQKKPKENASPPITSWDTPS